MNNFRTGLIGLVAVLVTFGGTVTLLPSEAENTYYCQLTDQIAVFHRLSTSLKTGYYMINEVEQSLACRDGRVYEEWIPLRQYLEEQGISWEEVLEPEAEPLTDFALVKGRQGISKCEYLNGAIDTYSRCYRNGIFKNYAGELICPA